MIVHLTLTVVKLGNREAEISSLPEVQDKVK